MHAKPQKAETPVPDFRQVVDSFVLAYKSGNAAKIASLFSESAVVIPPNEPPVQGVDKIRSRFESFFDGFAYHIDFEPMQTELIGSMGFERGKYSAWAVLKGEEQPRGGSGEYMILLEHHDGAWLISAFGTAAPGHELPEADDWYYQCMGVLKASSG